MAAREDEKCDVLQDKVHVESIEATSNNALEVYLAYSPEVAREIERKLVRKIDLHIMPFVVAMYLFNFLDRNSITQARLYGFQTDTHVEGTVYNTAIAIFSAGYILMQLPAAIMISKMRPHIFLVRRPTHPRSRPPVPVLPPTNEISLPSLSYGPLSARARLQVRMQPACCLCAFSWALSRLPSSRVRFSSSAAGTRRRSWG